MHTSHEAVHRSDVGDPRALDSTLMQWAVAHHRAVLTHDLDFGAALELSGAGKPNVVQIRTLNTCTCSGGGTAHRALQARRSDLQATGQCPRSNDEGCGTHRPPPWHPSIVRSQPTSPPPPLAPGNVQHWTLSIA
ncbi:MAG: DUF5615 family PIN-like protein [Cyanobacteriota bacterium]